MLRPLQIGAGKVRASNRSGQKTLLQDRQREFERERPLFRIPIELAPKTDLNGLVSQLFPRLHLATRRDTETILWLAITTATKTGAPAGCES